MRIGIIGAGHVGAALARKLAAAGNRISIANSRGPETLRQLEHQLGGNVRAATSADAMARSDVVILAVPFGRLDELPAEGSRGKIIVDATNYIPQRDGHWPELDSGESTSSELIQRHYPGARVTKAFNAMRWSHLRDYGHVDGAQHRYGIPVSGDDPAAKHTVFDLVEELGFEPVDAGALADGGRKYQPGTDVFAVDLSADELRSRVGIEP